MAVHEIIKEGVQAVAGGDYGPNAIGALRQTGIQVKGYPANKTSITVKELVDLFINNNLPEVTQ